MQGLPYMSDDIQAEGGQSKEGGVCSHLGFHSDFISHGISEAVWEFGLNS